MQIRSHLIEIAWPKNNGLPFYFTKPGIVMTILKVCSCSYKFNSATIYIFTQMFVPQINQLDPVPF